MVRTVTSVTKEKAPRRYKVSVEAPPGYDVTVEPSSLRLRQGESASYQVTIVNQGAPIDVWRFGSLTWNEKNGQYSVYSPVAVRGQLFVENLEIVAQWADGVGRPARPTGFDEGDRDGSIRVLDARRADHAGAGCDVGVHPL